jgi:parvulin-like peptidyl-prolyl isomerase
MPHRHFSHRVSLGICLLTLTLSAGSAALPEDVLLRNRWVEITRADFDDAIARMPANIRADYATSAKRVESLLNQLLVSKTLATQARSHGIAGEPGSAAAESTLALAAAELKLVAKHAGEEFDAKKADFEARAREVYTLNRETYREPEAVRISAITIGMKNRGEEAALARAKEARARIAAGEDFGAIAREYSDNRITRDKGGQLPFLTAKELEANYAKGVFALTRQGEISEPIKGKAAYHVVRLDERRPARVAPFEEVRDRILQDLRRKHVDAQREARLRSIIADPDLQVNQPVVNALVKPVETIPSTPAPGSGAPGASTQNPVPSPAR